MEQNEELKSIAAKSGNSNCFECGIAGNQWASVNNGVFLCLNCSGKHRGFGVHISFVRSVLMDNWTDKQLAKMKLGGNNRLRELFQDYGVLNLTPIDLKYRTKIAEYYRNLLSKEVDGELPPQKPSLEEGREMIESLKREIVDNGPNGITSAKRNLEEEKIGDTAKKALGFMAGFMKKAYTVTKDTTIAAGTKIHSTVTDPNFKQNIVESAINIKEKTIEISKDVADKGIAIGKKTVEVGAKTWEVSKKVAEKGVEYGPKVIDFTVHAGKEVVNIVSKQAAGAQQNQQGINIS